MIDINWCLYVTYESEFENFNFSLLESAVCTFCGFFFRIFPLYSINCFHVQSHQLIIPGMQSLGQSDWLFSFMLATEH